MEDRSVGDLIAEIRTLATIEPDPPARADVGDVTGELAKISPEAMRIFKHRVSRAQAAIDELDESIGVRLAAARDEERRFLAELRAAEETLAQLRERGVRLDTSVLQGLPPRDPARARAGERRDAGATRDRQSGSSELVRVMVAAAVGALVSAAVVAGLLLGTPAPSTPTIPAPPTATIPSPEG